MKPVQILSLSCVLSILLFSFTSAFPAAGTAPSASRAASVSGDETTLGVCANSIKSFPGRSHNCDFAAVIAKDGALIADIPNGPGPFDDPEDFFYDFIIAYSTQNLDNDGYGVVYSKDREIFLSAGQKYYSAEPYDVIRAPWTTRTRPSWTPPTKP